jgi:hypothetical protein
MTVSVEQGGVCSEGALSSYWGKGRRGQDLAQKDEHFLCCWATKTVRKMDKRKSLVIIRLFLLYQEPFISLLPSFQSQESKISLHLHSFEGKGYFVFILFQERIASLIPNRNSARPVFPGGDITLKINVVERMILHEYR